MPIGHNYTIIPKVEQLGKTEQGGWNQTSNQGFTYPVL